MVNDHDNGAGSNNADDPNMMSIPIIIYIEVHMSNKFTMGEYNKLLLLITMFQMIQCLFF